MFGFDSYAENFHALFEEVKKYLELQKQYLALDTAEKLTILLSAVATATVCLVLGGMALFFLLLATAVWIGQLAGSLAIGFLSMGVLILALMAIVYGKRQAWIIQPVARLIVGLFIHDERKEEAHE